MNQAIPQLDAPARTFTKPLPSTRHGARLLRVTRPHSWGSPQNLTERIELVVAELAANAVLHGRVPGRGFPLTLAFAPTHLSRRGLSLVAALADH